MKYYKNLIKRKKYSVIIISICTVLAGIFVCYLSVKDFVYGYEKRKNTSFIVTSGISDWEIKMKTCCKSEYVIINVLKDN